MPNETPEQAKRDIQKCIKCGKETDMPFHTCSGWTNDSAHKYISDLRLAHETHVKELEAVLKESQIYAGYKDETATVFMNQVKKLQADIDELNGYVKHTDECLNIRSRVGGKCICGLDTLKQEGHSKVKAWTDSNNSNPTKPV